MSKKHRSEKTVIAPSEAPSQDQSPYVHQNKKIDFNLSIRDFKWTENQQKIIDASLAKEHRMTVIDGVWGSGKSLIAVHCCLKLLQARKISNILYIRNIIQSGSGTLGWLGGDLQTRLSPYMVPLQQKLEELLPPSQVKKLVEEKIVESQPVALLRGTSYNAYGVIIDEVGCMTREDILLALSRIGMFSHVFAVGDSWQVDVKNSGFKDIYNIFDDQDSRDHGIYTYKLQDEMDVMRSDFLKFVMKKVKTATHETSEWRPHP